MSIHPGLPASEYHKREIGVVSNTALTLLGRSPAHYKTWVDGHDRKQTAAMEFGSAFHMALLESEKFKDSYVVEPYFGNCTNKANKAARDAWREQNTGRLKIEQEDYDATTGMIASVWRHPAASKLLDGGIPEVAIRWVDKETGLTCKSRADYWVSDKRLVVDVKTCEDASPEGFAKSVARYRYHCQNALYSMGFAACDAPIEHFVLLAVEKEPPYAVAVYTLDVESVGKGHSLARTNMETLRLCLERDEWIAYSNGITDLTIPRWSL